MLEIKDTFNNRRNTLQEGHETELKDQKKNLDQTRNQTQDLPIVRAKFLVETLTQKLSISINE